MRGFRESMDFALALYPNHMDIFPLAILPGTVLAGRSDAIGFAAPFRSTLYAAFHPNFQCDGADGRLGGWTLACDVFYTRGKAVAWFNSVVTLLGVKPSAFLTQFGIWLSDEKGESISEDRLDDDEIWSLQRSFLDKILKPKNLKRFSSTGS